jgi:hypothetical protein
MKDGRDEWQEETNSKYSVQAMMVVCDDGDLREERNKNELRGKIR